MGEWGGWGWGWGWGGKSGCPRARLPARLLAVRGARAVRALPPQSAWLVIAERHTSPSPPHPPHPSPLMCQGKRSCHTGYRRTAGWILPVGYLVSSGVVRVGGRGGSDCTRAGRDAVAGARCGGWRGAQRQGEEAAAALAPLPPARPPCRPDCLPPCRPSSFPNHFPLPHRAFTPTPTHLQIPPVTSNAAVNADAESVAAFFSETCAPTDDGALAAGGKWDGVCTACKVRHMHGVWRQGGAEEGRGVLGVPACEAARGWHTGVSGCKEAKR